MLMSSLTKAIFPLWPHHHYEHLLGLHNGEGDLLGSLVLFAVLPAEIPPHLLIYLKNTSMILSYWIWNPVLIFWSWSYFLFQWPQLCFYLKLCLYKYVFNYISIFWVIFQFFTGKSKKLFRGGFVIQQGLFFRFKIQWRINNQIN